MECWAVHPILHNDIPISLVVCDFLSESRWGGFESVNEKTGNEEKAGCSFYRQVHPAYGG